MCMSSSRNPKRDASSSSRCANSKAPSVLRASAVGGRKVGILRQADRINTQAANAFLKTLEEPPAESLLLLVSSLPESLPETILSRCIKVVLHTGGEAKTLSPEEVELREALDRFAREYGADPRGSLPAAYGLLREFSGLLSAGARALARRGGHGSGSRGNSLCTNDRRRVAGGTRKPITSHWSRPATRPRVRASWKALRVGGGDVLRCQAAGAATRASSAVATLAGQLSTAEVPPPTGSG